MDSSSTRAAPLPPEDRRRLIARAVVPLIAEHGATVTSKQMAEAAGVSEGTIFKVFDDKCSVLREAIRISLDPQPILVAIRDIPADAPLPVQLAEAARILLDRSERAWTLVAVLRSLQPAVERPDPPAFVAESAAVVTTALTELFARHADNLRIEPAKAGTVFRGLLYASQHPFIDVPDRLTVDEIVDVVLSGVAEPAAARTS